MVFLAIWATVSISTMWAIRQSTITRGDARAAANLALIAQTELERARMLPVTELQSGAQVVTRDGWPTGTSCTLTLTPRGPATWTLDVTVERDAARPIKPVRLTTVRAVMP